MFVLGLPFADSGFSGIAIAEATGYAVIAVLTIGLNLSGHRVDRTVDAPRGPRDHPSDLLHDGPVRLLPHTGHRRDSRRRRSAVGFRGDLPRRRTGLRRNMVRRERARPADRRVCILFRRSAVRVVRHSQHQCGPAVPRALLRTADPRRLRQPGRPRRLSLAVEGKHHWFEGPTLRACNRWRATGCAGRPHPPRSRRPAAALRRRHRRCRDHAGSPRPAHRPDSRWRNRSCRPRAPP